MEGIFQRNFHVIAQICAAAHLLATAATSAAESLPKDRLEDVANVAEILLAAAAAKTAGSALLKGCVAKAIIGCALLRVFQDFIGRANSLKLGFGLCITGIAVRVKLHRKLAIGRFERCRIRIARNAQ